MDLLGERVANIDFAVVAPNEELTKREITFEPVDELAVAAVIADEAVVPFFSRDVAALSRANSIVGLAAMTNGGDVDEIAGVVDLVEHAPIADADPPRPLCVTQLLRSWRPRRGGQRSDLLPDAFDDLSRKRLELLRGLAADGESILSHEACRP